MQKRNISSARLHKRRTDWCCTRVRRCGRGTCLERRGFEALERPRRWHLLLRPPRLHHRRRPERMMMVCVPILERPRGGSGVTVVSILEEANASSTNGRLYRRRTKKTRVAIRTSGTARSNTRRRKGYRELKRRKRTKRRSSDANSVGETSARARCPSRWRFSCSARRT